MSKGKPCFENLEDSLLSGEKVMITLCKKPRISYAFPVEIIKDLQKISQGKTLRFAAVRQMKLSDERREELRERMKVLGAQNRTKIVEEKIVKKPNTEPREGYRAKMKRLRLEAENEIKSQE